MKCGHGNIYIFINICSDSFHTGFNPSMCPVFSLGLWKTTVQIWPGTGCLPQEKFLLYLKKKKKKAISFGLLFYMCTKYWKATTNNK